MIQRCRSSMYHRSEYRMARPLRTDRPTVPIVGFECIMQRPDPVRPPSQIWALLCRKPVVALCCGLGFTHFVVNSYIQRGSSLTSLGAPLGGLYCFNVPR